jgi:hypothetical protein
MKRALSAAFFSAFAAPLSVGETTIKSDPD